MKNALIFTLFSAFICISVNAQEPSPTKEVTVQSINKYMNEAVGMKQYSLRKDDSGNYTIRVNEYTIEENGFDLDKISLKEFVENHSYTTGEYLGTRYEYRTYSQLNWDNFTIAIDSSESLFYEPNLARITIYPTSKCRWDHECIAGTYNVGCTQTEYYNNFTIYIPKNRVASCHKALQHLKELMKEDDPFGN
jgi:hypothetical protein